MSEQNRTEKDIYLYLDFAGHVKQDVLAEPVHLQIANLDKENPLVQLNERVFKGEFK